MAATLRGLSARWKNQKRAEDYLFGCPRETDAARGMATPQMAKNSPSCSPDALQRLGTDRKLAMGTKRNLVCALLIPHPPDKGPHGGEQNLTGIRRGRSAESRGERGGEDDGSSDGDILWRSRGMIAGHVRRSGARLGAAGRHPARRERDGRLGADARPHRQYV